MSDFSTSPEHVALATRVSKIEYWKTGNGSHGAETRITKLEDAIRDLEQLQLDEKFPGMRKILFDLRDSSQKVAEDVERLKEASVSGEQLELVMGKVLHEIDKKIGDKDKGRAAKIKAFAPYFVALCSVLGSLAVVAFK